MLRQPQSNLAPTTERMRAPLTRRPSCQGRPHSPACVAPPPRPGHTTSRSKHRRQVSPKKMPHREGLSTPRSLTPPHLQGCALGLVPNHKSERDPGLPKLGASAVKQTGRGSGPRATLSAVQVFLQPTPRWPKPSLEGWSDPLPEALPFDSAIPVSITQTKGENGFGCENVHHAFHPRANLRTS